MGSDSIQLVIYNTIKSWHYMRLLWIKQTMESVWCDLVLLRRVYYVILRYRSYIKCIYVFLNKFRQHAQKCYLYYTTTYITWYIIIFPMIDKVCSRVSSTRHFLFYTTVFLYVHIHMYQISQISVILTKLEPSTSEDMWPHVFRSEVRSYFSFFLVMYADYICLFLVFGNCSLTLKSGSCWNPL